MLLRQVLGPQAFGTRRDRSHLGIKHLEQISHATHVPRQTAEGSQHLGLEVQRPFRTRLLEPYKAITYIYECYTALLTLQRTSRALQYVTQHIGEPTAQTDVGNCSFILSGKY